MGCIFWLAFIILLLCLFLVNWEAIRRTMRNTRFLERVLNQPETEQINPEPPPVPLPEITIAPETGPTGTPPRTAENAPVNDPTPGDGAPAGGNAGETTGPVPTGEPALPPAQPASPPATGPAAGPAAPSPAATAPSPAANPPAAAPQPARQSPGEAPRENRERTIYFMQIDPDDGRILRIKTPRQIPVSDSPLRDTLEALLRGPTAEEADRGLISLIPPETRLLGSPTIRGETAYINFSENFQFNTYGAEGYTAQLRQVVWTATEFPTVTDVQILIEGRRLDYLGESIRIGSPLNKDGL